MELEECSASCAKDDPSSLVYFASTACVCCVDSKYLVCVDRERRNIISKMLKGVASERRRRRETRERRERRNVSEESVRENCGTWKKIIVSLHNIKSWVTDVHPGAFFSCRLQQGHPPVSKRQFCDAATFSKSDIGVEQTVGSDARFVATSRV